MVCALLQCFFSEMDKMSDSESDCSCPEELHVFENGLPPVSVETKFLSVCLCV